LLRGVIGALRGKVGLHRGTVNVLRGTDDVHRDTITLRRDKLNVPRDAVRVPRGTVTLSRGTVTVTRTFCAMTGVAGVGRAILADVTESLPFLARFPQSRPRQADLGERIARTSRAVGTRSLTMRTIPRDTSGKIAFCRTHLEPWAENATLIGTSPEQVAELAARIEAADQARREQGAAKQAAQAATLRLQMAVDAMDNLAQSIVQQVRAKASVTGGDTVYVAASISPPDKGSPLAEPGQPYGFAVELQQVGILTLTWKCKNPRGSAGTMYHVSRKIGDEPFKFIGSNGKKTFVDRTLPAGTPRVIYKVQAVRSTGAGDSAEFPLSLGNPGGIPIGMMPRTTQLTVAA
jgi:hypothetical protein